jgi:arginine exporter protein ArgO
MFDALVSGLVAGWGVAVPLGAIGVLLVDLGMRGGFRHAAPAAAAVATADLLYAAVAAAAGTAAATLLAPHERELKLVAAGVLAAVAVVGLRAARRRARREAAEATARGATVGPVAAGRPSAGVVPAAEAAGGPGHRLFARFLGLTAVNPTTVLYFAALIAGLPAIADAEAPEKAMFVVAVGIASLSWQLTLAGAGAALHHRLPDGARLYTALAGNAIVLGLAAKMALSA